MISVDALLDELVDLGLIKIAVEGISTQQAQDALRRLRDLEDSKPTAGQLLRGAGVGAIAGPVAAGVSRVISGGVKRGLAGTARDIAGQAASGAIYGGAIPFARHHLESGVEKKKLKGYLDTHDRQNRLQGQIKKTLGV